MLHINNSKNRFGIFDNINMINHTGGTVDDSRYIVFEKVGNGSYGEVFRCQDRYTGEIVCIKDISFNSNKQLMKSLNEIEILKQLSHPFIVSYRDAYSVDQRIKIIMEYAEHYDLDRLVDYHIKSKTFLPENDIIRYFIEICSAINYMHSKGIIHRDIKLKNILVFNYSKCVKLADFGLSKILDETKNTLTFVGSIHFISPEICNGNSYGSSTDIWSLGVVLYILMARRRPFGGRNQYEIAENIKKGLYDVLPGQALSSLVEQMLNKDPSKRPTSSMIMENPFIVEFLKNDVDLANQIKQYYGMDGCLIEINPVSITKNNTNIESEKSMIEKNSIDSQSRFSSFSDQSVCQSETPINQCYKTKILKRIGINIDTKNISKPMEIELIRRHIESCDSTDSSDIENYLDLKLYKLISYNNNCMHK
ncbi:hypothetical protein PPL_03799 [Heterostelium album PN500]|uniref:non-specific serine/threonine protein kinase n=1 Tax=Heterostelium pallidum (strain ATCC 26659 / Pp 5 / PN500) TaxID=670386 RepID=D3B6P7_HETP5|nr:hypothetical protein PPL_03799 [Heterostelium album PN500]EFA83017.1 hypothetical protein PPL_03799 [Heterostelium album PN500]|eukprot:XP_020435134.1 hypothetical protein PPL_03799 [Heterostelium album PN500]